MPTQHAPRREARVERPQGVGESFSGVYACPEYPRLDFQPIWRLLFFDEIQDFPDNLENP